MARRRGFQPRTGARRKTAWTVGPQEVDRTLTSSTAVIWSAGVILTNEPEVTIVRTRGIITATLEVVAAIGDGFFGAVGIGVVTSAAFTAGVASVPTPLTEEQWDGWLFHTYFDVRSVTATIGDGVNAVGAVVRIPIDSKAMRIFTEDMTLIGVTEVVESGASNMEMQGQTRILVKLP